MRKTGETGREGKEGCQAEGRIWEKAWRHEQVGEAQNILGRTNCNMLGVKGAHAEGAKWYCWGGEQGPDPQKSCF